MDAGAAAAASVWWGSLRWPAAEMWAGQAKPQMPQQMSWHLMIPTAARVPGGGGDGDAASWRSCCCCCSGRLEVPSVLVTEREEAGCIAGSGRDGAARAAPEAS